MTLTWHYIAQLEALTRTTKHKCLFVGGMSERLWPMSHCHDGNVNCCISSKLLDSQLFKLKSTNHVLLFFKLLWNQQTEAVHTGTPALVCCDVMFQCYSSTRTKRRHGHDRRLKGTICCVIWATMRRWLPASRSRLPPKSECVSVGAVQLLPVSDCRPSGTVPRPVS